MRKVILSTIFLVSAFASAQVNKTLGDFDKVTAFDKISVQLIPSTENKIEITGNRSQEVEIVTVKDELKIRMPFGKLLKGEDIVAKVYFKKIEALEANEGSYISCDSVLKAINFNMIAKEGGQIKAQIEATRIAAKASSGSILKISGTAQNLEFVVSSGGKIEADKCQTTQATASINAGGSIDVRASDFVDAKIRAGGTIVIYGNPKQVNQKTMLGGEVIMSKR